MSKTIQLQVLAALVVTSLVAGWADDSAAQTNVAKRHAVHSVASRMGGSPKQSPVQVYEKQAPIQVEAGCDCGGHSKFRGHRKGCGVGVAHLDCGCGYPGGCPTCVPPILPAMVRGIDTVLDSIFTCGDRCHTGCQDSCCAPRPTPKNYGCYGYPGHPGCGSPNWFCKIHKWHRKHAYRGCWDDYGSHGSYGTYVPGAYGGPHKVIQGPVWEETVEPMPNGSSDEASPMLPPKPPVDQSRYRSRPAPRVGTGVPGTSVMVRPRSASHTHRLKQPTATERGPSKKADDDSSRRVRTAAHAPSRPAPSQLQPEITAKPVSYETAEPRIPANPLRR